MTLAELLPKRLYHSSRIELWGLALAEADLAPPPLPRGLGIARLAGPDAPAPLRARLAAAMAPAPEAEIRARLAAGRRAYVVEAPAEVVSYGWASLEDEQIAEIEGTIRVRPGEAYVWDCATVPEWRGRGLYPALLRGIARDLAVEGFERLWIAARAENAASLRGFEKAGFVRVARVAYRRVWRWRRTAVRSDPQTPLPRVAASRVVA
jgi:ribosomal protein S18 acetylase RimI-like enzyme